MQKGYAPNWHHELIAKKLEDVASGKCKRLMLFMPPRHGKTELATIKFPAWYLGKNPYKEVMCCSYSADLAEEFGRKARTTVADPLHAVIFPECKLQTGSKSATSWKVSARGGFTATGVGGAITGKGANVLIIDDPIKNREEADSDTYRKKVWDWYTSTAYTRLEKDGAVIVIMCMVGDTKVLMSDGTEKELKDIRPGDEVATYENNKLSTAKVKHWANQGSDFTLTIRTSSGILVTANERHPFLIKRNQKLEWVKLKDLKLGDKIVSVKNGEHTKELSVKQKDVISQQNVKSSVTPIITNINGQVDIDLHQSTLSLDTQQGLDIDTELSLKITKECLRNKKESVQSVSNSQGKTSERTGEENSVLTTTMKQGELEDSFVTTATSQLDTQKLKKSCSAQLSTYEITLDEIVDISEHGYEDVFDIQVERTENFIANGLVSHNTRWHDDDLAGRLLQLEGEKGYTFIQSKNKWEKCPEHKKEQGKWDVIRFPAVSIEQESYRKIGEPLWESKYDLTGLAEIKSAIGLRDWGALYQQDPVTEEGADFHNEWFDYWKRIPKGVRYVTTVDLAISQKESADDSVVLTVAFDAHDNIYVVKYKNWKANPSEVIDEIYDRYNEFGGYIGIESVGYQESMFHYLRLAGQTRGRYLPVEQIRTRSNKESKIRGLIPFYANNKIFHAPAGMDELEDQLKRFPSGKHDDIIDSLAMTLGLLRRPMIDRGSGIDLAKEAGIKYGIDGKPYV